MKGLLYKDLLLSRKYYIVVFLYCLLFALLAVLMRISMICGNLADNKEVVESLTRNMYILRYTPGAAMLIAFINDGGTDYSDIRSGWLRFSRITALRPEKLVGAKLVFKASALTAALIFSLAYMIVFGLIGGDGITPGMLCNILSVYLLSMAVSFLVTAFAFIFRKKQISQMICVGTVGVAGLLLTVLMMVKLDKIDASQDIDLLDFLKGEFSGIINYILPAAAALFVISAVLSYIASVKALKRREG